MIAATALWALGSNAQQHDRVRDIVLRHLRRAEDDAATRALAEQLALSSRQDEPVLFYTTGATRRRPGVVYRTLVYLDDGS